MNHRNVLTRPRAALGLGIATALAFSVAAAAAPPPSNATVDETAHTSAAVVAADDHWLRAEEDGDTAWLDAMLMPGYRTVGADGKVGTKAMLLAGAKKNRDSHKMRKQVQAWQKTHPTRTSVLMPGDTALVTFADPATGRISSSDLFVYTHGGWHALYSQHAKIE